MLDGCQKSLHPCALGESSPGSIGRGQHELLNANDAPKTKALTFYFKQDVMHQLVSLNALTIFVIVDF